jgi:hypothetical protein
VRTLSRANGHLAAACLVVDTQLRERGSRTSVVPVADERVAAGYALELGVVAGPFHALLTPTGVKAWVGEERCPMTWPDGFSVRLDPIELLGPDGHVLAREGDVLYATGGRGSDGTFSIGPVQREEAGTDGRPNSATSLATSAVAYPTTDGQSSVHGHIASGPAAAPSWKSVDPTHWHQRESCCVKGLVGASSVVCPCIAEWGWSRQRVIGLW